MLIRTQYNSPEDFISAIQTALECGDHATAQQISTQATENYPHHKQLLKYAHVLAPPKISIDKRPLHRDTQANQNWIKENRNEYKGQWVALRNGQLLSSASSAKELIEQLGDTKGIFLTAIY
ncbi:hypothetical protein [Gloeocapsopsis sp. IPPAS B-1203]|uniref:hypothetical protein n=1 Tax=Gloeocapsopsis sp. IPPAS B-1203 TaxID=2049454 RepID=UPI0025A0BDB8|nr:hypothetical protein [Gloeocapsopsis sp. IPPAS B-1203]